MSDLVAGGSKYTDQARRAAAVSYAVLGNMQQVSRSLRIPPSTLYDWCKSDWWEPLCVAVRDEKEDEIVAGLGRIVEKAIRETEDRLENGDVYVHR